MSYNSPFPGRKAFIHVSNQDVSSGNYRPDTVFSAGDTGVNKTNKKVCILGLVLQWREMNSKKSIIENVRRINTIISNKESKGIMEYREQGDYDFKYAV